MRKGQRRKDRKQEKEEREERERETRRESRRKQVKQMKKEKSKVDLECAQSSLFDPALFYPLFPYKIMQLGHRKICIPRANFIQV